MDTIPVGASFHSPNEPKYTNLFQLIKPIIPHAFPPAPDPPEHPNIQVVKSILNTTDEMNKKLDGVDPHRKALLEKVIELAHKLLSAYYSTGELVSDEERDKMLKLFADALKGPEIKHKLKSKAPFSKLGEDGFEDVDHQILAMEIKRLAVSLTAYLKERMRESLITAKSGANLNDPSTRVKFETDYVLTQTTAIMAKLHRAILRNHHHILMVIGNFAGNAASVTSASEHDDSSKGTKVDDKKGTEDVTNQDPVETILGRSDEKKKYSSTEKNTNQVEIEGEKKIS